MSLITVDAGLSPWKMATIKIQKNKLAMFGLIVISILVVLAILAPVITPYDRDHIDMLKVYQAPSSEHWLGMDELGRDVLTRLIYGARVSISVGIVSTVISVSIGVILGAVAGYT